MSGSALFVQPPGSIPIPMLADLDGQCYYASGGISRFPLVIPNAASPSAYTVGQTLGGVTAIPNAARAVGNGSGIIYGVTAMDPSRNVGQIDLLFFNSIPGGTFTDKTEAVLVAGDFSKVVGSLHIVDWTVYGATTGCSVGNSGGTGLFFQLGKTGDTVNTTLYVVPIVRAAMTVGLGWMCSVKILPD